MRCTLAIFAACKVRRRDWPGVERSLKQSRVASVSVAPIVRSAQDNNLCLVCVSARGSTPVSGSAQENIFGRMQLCYSPYISTSTTVVPGNQNTGIGDSSPGIARFYKRNL